MYALFQIGGYKYDSEVCDQILKGKCFRIGCWKSTYPPSDCYIVNGCIQNQLHELYCLLYLVI